jgi:hypothetical protein
MSEKVEIKRIDIKEFREKGYLFELNRRFLHPLGMALEVIISDETGKESLGGIWDYRDDPEGIIFVNLDEAEVAQRAKFIDDEILKRLPAREILFGQPVSIQPYMHCCSDNNY